MTEKELNAQIAAIERRLEHLQNIEERLEKCFRNVEKFRDKMIQNGYSYAMLEEFNKAIQPVVQHCNEIRNAKRKLALIREEQQRREKEAREWKEKRTAAILKRLTEKQEPEFPYNYQCRNFSLTDGEAVCEIKMDLQYCSRKCPYATTEPASNKVDYKGNVIPKKKRGT